MAWSYVKVVLRLAGEGPSCRRVAIKICLKCLHEMSRVTRWRANSLILFPATKLARYLLNFLSRLRPWDA